MTEACGVVTLTPLSQKVGTPGSGGRLVSGVRARVVKADGTLAGVGEPGELMVTAPFIALRYMNDKKA